MGSAADKEVGLRSAFVFHIVFDLLLVSFIGPGGGMGRFLPSF